MDACRGRLTGVWGGGGGAAELQPGGLVFMRGRGAMSQHGCVSISVSICLLLSLPARVALCHVLSLYFSLLSQT